jgi:hypothetical protein
VSDDTRGGVLLLSHVGYSFLDDLIAVLDARGLRSLVLTSRPEEHLREDRLSQLRAKAGAVYETATHELTHADVEACLAELHARGEQVLCCVSVWEGYRHLMALANGQLGAPDLDDKQVSALRDKLALRNRLADAGLSRVRAEALTPDTLRERRQRGTRAFIKPVTGIASYGAFPLTAETTWAEIERVAAGLRHDTVYANALGDGHSFLIEDYVPGREFSFEVIVVGGAAFVVAVHEKCEVTETSGTVLENACTSPPLSIPARDVAAGVDWVSRLLAHLALDWGCFHVEARHHASRWELIEINPRVGGSLISPSVRALTGGWDLLSLWLDSLLTALPGRDDAARAFRELLERLAYAPDGTAPGAEATFFRVFFAEPGTVLHVGLNPELTMPPLVSQILLKPGDTVTTDVREVFLGQLLWRLPRAERDARLPELVGLSRDAIVLDYDADPRHSDRGSHHV